MKNIQSLLQNYEVTYSREADLPYDLEISPTIKGHGLPIYLNGSFDDSLENVAITNFSTVGAALDIINDSEINEDLFYSLTHAVLEGRYRYELQRLTLKDWLGGGVVYLTIGEEGEELLKKFRCINQREIKKMLRDGELRPTPYDRKNV